jgi:hypothetical protein
MKGIARAFNKCTYIMHLKFKSKILHWSLNEQFGFKSKILHGFLTDFLKVPGWDSAPESHNEVSNVNFDIGVEVDSTQISCKIPNDKVLVHLGFKSKVSLAS